MFDLLKIKLFGRQPAARISRNLLDRLIARDYKSHVSIVKTILKKLSTENQAAKNRVSAAILKLANGDVSKLEGLIETANNDYRDILMQAEYPRCANFGFGELDKKLMKQICKDDFVEYSKWLKKP